MYFTLNRIEQFLPQYIRAKFSFRQSAYKHFPVSSSSSSRSRLSALYRAVRAFRLSLFLLSKLPSYLREQLVELSFLQLRLFPFVPHLFPSSCFVFVLCTAQGRLRQAYHRTQTIQTTKNIKSPKLLPRDQSTRPSVFRDVQRFRVIMMNTVSL